jgi:hypothetical protein
VSGGSGRIGYRRGGGSNLSGGSGRIGCRCGRNTCGGRLRSAVAEATGGRILYWATAIRTAPSARGNVSRRGRQWSGGRAIGQWPVATGDERSQHAIIQAQVVLQFAVERIIHREGAQVVGTLQKVVVPFPDGVRETPGSPHLFGGDFAFAIGDERFDVVPGGRGLILVEHWAENRNDFKVAQVLDS